MFLTGLNDCSEAIPTFWTGYIHATLIRALSYGREDLVGSWAAAAGGQKVYYSPPDDNLLSGVTIVKDVDTAVVAFQGTSNNLQLIQQIMQAPQGSIAGVPGTVNGYYGNCFQERLAAFQGILAGLPAGFRLYFIGHSAGGALAHVAYNYFAQLKFLKAWGAMTFGQPRTGNPTFADQTRRPFVRWIAQDDLVVGLPPSTYQAYALIGPLATTVLGLNYRHPRPGWILFDDGAVRQGDSWIVDAWGPPSQFPFLRLRNAWPDCYNAHQLLNYTNRLLPLTRGEATNPGIEQFVSINGQMS